MEKVFLSMVCLLSLVACGGGSGSSTNSSNSSPSNFSVGGAAATGAAIVGGAVSAKCANGVTGSGTTNSDGTYSVSLTGATLPCILKVNFTDATGATSEYYSTTTSASNGSATANITPMSHLVVANLVGQDPATAFTSFTNVASNVNSTALDTSVTNVKTALSNLGISLGNINPITTALTPALPDSGMSTDAQDKQIDQMMAALNAGMIPVTSGTNNLTSLMFSGGQGANATTMGTAINNLITTQAATGNIIPTSTYSGCPFATSGQYVTANMPTNSTFDATQNNFGLISINFGNAPMTVPGPNGSVTVPANTILKGNGTTQLAIQPATNAADCRFQAIDTNSGNSLFMEFSVSPAGFIVGSNLPMGTSTDQTAAPKAFNNSNTSARLGIGIPLQSQIAAASIAGNWNMAEWVFPTNGTSGFTNYFEKAVVTNNNGTLSVTSYGCDGGVTCSQSGNTFNISKCASTTCKDSGNTPLNNVFTVTDNNGTDIKVAAFKAPNNDLIGVMIGKNAGFSQIFGVIHRASGDAVLPPSGKQIKNPQWKLQYTGGACANSSGSTLTLCEAAQAYTVSNPTAATNSSSATITMNFTDAADANYSQTVLMDNPRKGMVYRAYNAGSNTKEMVGLRGNGWAVAGGTTKVADYPNMTTNAGKFFAINIKY